MRCRNPKCKGTKRLRTLRTFDNKEQTRREKRCPKCGAQSFTVELDEKERAEELQFLADENQRQLEEMQQLGEQHGEVREWIRSLVMFGTRETGGRKKRR